MLPINYVALLCGFIATTTASSAIVKSALLEKRCALGSCSAKGGSAWCHTQGCDGACLTSTDRCFGSAQCNTRFSNCKRTIEYDIALAAGKIVEREDGSVEVRSDDAMEYVAGVLETMRK